MLSTHYVKYYSSQGGEPLKVYWEGFDSSEYASVHI